MYNFQVAGTHTYFVSRAGFLVHNACFSPEKAALVDMAKMDKNIGTGISQADMQAYIDLNKGLPDPFPANKVRLDPGHGPNVNPVAQGPHGHVGPVDYIRVK